MPCLCDCEKHPNWLAHAGTNSCLLVTISFSIAISGKDFMVVLIKAYMYYTKFYDASILDHISLNGIYFIQDSI